MLPLRPTAFSVLAALADSPLHGYAIMEAVNDTLPARPVLGPGTLYRLLREMRREGLIDRVEPPPGEEGGEDERRSYHALTALGRAALKAEGARLRRTLEAAGILKEAGT